MSFLRLGSSQGIANCADPDNHEYDEKDDRHKAEGDGPDEPYGSEESNHSAPSEDHLSGGFISIVWSWQNEGGYDQPEPEYQEDEWYASEWVEVANTDEGDEHYGAEDYEEYSSVQRSPWNTRQLRS